MQNLYVDIYYISMEKPCVKYLSFCQFFHDYPYLDAEFSLIESALFLNTECIMTRHLFHFFCPECTDGTLAYVTEFGNKKFKI